MSLGGDRDGLWWGRVGWSGDGVAWRVVRWDGDFHGGGDGWCGVAGWGWVGMGMGRGWMKGDEKGMAYRFSLSPVDDRGARLLCATECSVQCVE